MEKQALYIDPRTKLFLLLVMNIVMLDTSSGVLLPYLRFIIGFLPFVLLLTSKRFKPAWVYLVIYLISHIIAFFSKPQRDLTNVDFPAPFLPIIAITERDCWKMAMSCSKQKRGLIILFLSCKT